MNIRKLSLICSVFLLCQVGFSQSVNRNLVSQALATAAATGKAVQVMPSYKAQSGTRPLIMVTGQKFTNNPLVKPTNAPGEPSFCDWNSGSQIAVCAKGVETGYGTNFLGANGGAGMTIAIVDFFAYANAESNLAKFDTDMGLPACTTGNGCFHSVALTGIDGSGTGWDVESMLDIEYAHSMAPNAHIVYVQGDPYGDPGYYAESIAALGCPASPYCAMYGIVSSPAGDVVSNSWTYSDGPNPADDPFYALGKVLLFASGDDASFPANSVESYPCTSTNGTCIGGTALHLNSNLTRASETAWSDAGGGCSAYFLEPSWQGPQGSGVCAPYRAAPDIAAIADTATPVAVYISDAYYNGYYGVGGTSVATPVTAGLVADIDTARVYFGKTPLTYLNTDIYAAANYNYGYFFYDITSGNNGYPAGPGYDLVTGLGNLTGKDAANRFFGLP